ncbi:uncharacterized protein L201_005908 [Kwoniella dendrophila CBS 6074]|uniref:Uncharacterized protein n=1 Tax=Kwoniella dendrophila CBS 6074 TaxID=1295534 RepID=A0AAX4K002_9TREE
MCTAENISNSARQSLKQHQFSTLFEYLEVDIKISECQIVVLDDEPRLKSIFKAWSENQGPFEFPIDTLIFTMMSIPSKSFLDEWAEFKNEQGENRRLPRKWCLAIDEHEEQPRIMSIIEELCTQVEELTLRSWHRDINGGYTVSLSSIQDFFNNPIRWPSNNILKSLDILLNLDGSVSSESSREIVFPAHNTEPINLQRLTITLDARDAHRHMGTYGTINNVIIQNIPPSAQIARAMLSIGGTGCHYDFKIITGYGEEIDGLGARVNADIKEEMMKIWDNDERSIGWTRIAKQKP